MKHPMVRAFVASVLLVLVAIPGVGQSTILVPTQQPTIQAGIAAAVSGDTIVVAPGTYNESNIDFLGKAVTVTSSGGASITIVDPQNQGRAFLFLSGETPGSILDGFTVRNGRAPNGSLAGVHEGGDGGAIFGSGASPIIRNCIFMMNRAGNGVFSFSVPSIVPVADGGDGGAIAFDGGSPTIVDCSFSNNFAGDGGGTDDPPAGAGGNGGAISLMSSNATITGCQFSANISGGGAFSSGTGGAGGNGGAISSRTGAIAIEDCTFNGNLAGGAGGGDSGSGTPGEGGACRLDGIGVVVRGSTFIANRSADGNSTAGAPGGALSFAGGTLVIEDSSFEQNLAGNGGSDGDLGFAGGAGGAVEIALGQATIRRSAFRTNRSGNGATGGISDGRGGFGAAVSVRFVAATPPTLLLEDCLFQNNQAGITPLFPSMTPNATGGSGGAVASAGPLSAMRCAFLGNATGAASTAMYDGFSNFPLGGRGGAIFAMSTLTVDGCYFIGNVTGGSADGLPPSTGSRGGAIYSEGPTTTVRSSTFVDNVCGTFNAVAAPGSAVASTSPTRTLSHLIIRGGTLPRLDGTFMIDHSNIEGGAMGTGNIDSAPLFVDALHGNYRLATGSPCIDAGSMLAAAFDFDGEPRTVGLAPDIGADEYLRMGTSDDIELTMHVDGDGTGYGAGLQPPVAAQIDAKLLSPGGTFDFAPFVIATRSFSSGAGPFAPPAIPFAHIGVAPGFSILVEPYLFPGGNVYSLPVPAGLGGTTTRVQMFCFSPSASNGLLAASAAFDIVWP